MKESNHADIRILVVNDNGDVLNSTDRLLTGAGFSVNQAASGAEILPAIQEHRPDLLILDRDLPDVDGLTVCRQLKQNPALADIFVVIASGRFTASEEQSVGLESGADGYIVRPIANRELLARVNAFVRILKLTRSLRDHVEELKALNEAARQSSQATLNLMEDAMAAGDRLAAVNRDLQNKIMEARQSDQLMVTSEARYRRLFEAAKDGILILNAETGRIVDVNPFLTELLGCSRGTFIGKHLWDLGFFKDFAANQAKFVELQANDYVRYDDLALEASDGRRIEVEFISNAYLVDDYRVIQCNIRDISERKLAERRIRHLNRVYALLSDINKLIVREKERTALLVATCRIAVETGKFRMAWVGLLNPENQHLDPVGSAGFVDGYTDEVNIDLRDPSSLSGPAATCLRSGEYVICNDIEHDPGFLPWREEALRRGYRSSGGFPLKIGGKTIGVLNLYAGTPQFFTVNELGLLDELAKNISFALEVAQHDAERRRMEESHARLAMCIEQASETVMITDLAGAILYANPAFEKSSGYTCAEALGQNSRILKSGKHDAEFYRQMWETLIHGKVWHGLLINGRKDGTLYEEEATISPSRDEKGVIVNYVAVKRDVTRERLLETQFHQSQKMESIGQLAGGIAHDFNNILAAIMMQAELACMIEEMPAEVRHDLNGILAGAQRAASLTRQLLLFSRKQVMQPRNLDLNEVVTSLAKMLRRILGEDVRLELRLQRAPLMTFADPGMLDQVLMNLVVNARDAMPEGGLIILETANKIIDEEQAALNPEASPGRYAWFSVSDTGRGIPQEIQSRIFEPFFTTKEVGKGTGLGLATVYGIVKQHHGWLTLYSQVGRGTTFQIFLPASDVAAEDLVGLAAKYKPLGGSETILVAEDDERVRILTRKVLERAGYRVLEATDGTMAQQVWALNQSRVALLLTDLVMPNGVDGRELANRLLGRKKDLKVIFTSGYSVEIAGHELKLQPGQNFVQKPYSSDQILEAIRKTLDG